MIKWLLMYLQNTHMCRSVITPSNFVCVCGTYETTSESSYLWDPILSLLCVTFVIVTMGWSCRQNDLKFRTISTI